MKSIADSRLAWVVYALVTLTLSGCAAGPQWLGFAPPPQRFPGPVAQAKGLVPVSYRDPESPFERASILHQQLAAAKDEIKNLNSRIALMDDLLRAKEKFLQQANSEIELTRKEITKHQLEMKRWKSETQILRSQLDSVNSDHEETLKLIKKTLEELLQQDASLSGR